MNTMIDLCAGTGAFTIAFSQVGYKCVFSNDYCKNSKKIYDANCEDTQTFGDLHDTATEDLPNFDILTSGFPCQPFSISGKREGFNDDRSNIFWKIIDIVKSKNPKCILLENVKNLVGHDNGRTFDVIKTNLEECGYNIVHRVLDTSKITGIPHHRERIYIVCFRKDIVFDRDNILKFDNIQKKDLKYFLQEGKVDDKYYYTSKHKVYDKIAETVVDMGYVYQYRRTYVRRNESKVCPTLTANMGTGGHNVPIIKDDFGIRKLTPRECFNLQGFEKEYKLTGVCDSGLYKLAGNAVSLNLVKMIASQIHSVLSSQ